MLRVSYKKCHLKQMKKFAYESWENGNKWWEELFYNNQLEQGEILEI